jgi:pantothenate kinase type III
VQEVAGLIVLTLWLAFLFVGLAVSADDFFCPNLQTISNTLRSVDKICNHNSTMHTISLKVVIHQIRQIRDQPESLNSPFSTKYVSILKGGIRHLSGEFCILEVGVLAQSSFT